MSDEVKIGDRLLDGGGIEWEVYGFDGDWLKVRGPYDGLISRACLAGGSWHRVPRSTKPRGGPAVGQWYREGNGKGLALVLAVEAERVQYDLRLSDTDPAPCPSWCGLEPFMRFYPTPCAPPPWATPTAEPPRAPETPRPVVCDYCQRAPGADRIMGRSALSLRLCDRCYMCDEIADSELQGKADARIKQAETIPGSHHHRLADSAPWALLRSLLGGWNLREQSEP